MGPGVNGAAYVLTVARILECVVLLFLTYQHDLPAAGRLRELVSIKRPLLTHMRTSMPVIIGEIIWSLGITVYAGIYARISTESIAAYNIASTIEGVAFVPFIGLGNAAAILIGQNASAPGPRRGAAFCQALCAAIGWRRPAHRLAHGPGRTSCAGLYGCISPQAQADALGILFVMSVVLAVKAGNMMMVVGVLRSGGDTRFALLADTGPMWTIGVPLALLGSFVLHLPIYWVVLMVMSEEVVKFAY